MRSKDTALLPPVFLTDLSTAHTQAETTLTDSKLANREMKKLHYSLQIINRDLSQKKMEYSWKMTENYLNYCIMYHKLISTSNENYLKVLAYEEKPKELEREAADYKEAKEKVEKKLKKYKEYRELLIRRSEARGESEQKDINGDFKNFHTRIWNADESYQTLRNQEAKALRMYRIATVRYMLNECKQIKQVMPTHFIEYSDRRNLEKSDPLLNILLQEVSLLKSLQKHRLQEYYALKYRMKAIEE